VSGTIRIQEKVEGLQTCTKDCDERPLLAATTSSPAVPARFNFVSRRQP
jgi:hypothetical protein